MPLLEIHIDSLHEPDVQPQDSIEQQIAAWIAASRARIQRYWDSFKEKPLPQYVECDFDFVAENLQTIVQLELADGKLFVEWGCGFGVVTGIASLLGLDAVGIEAEEFLVQEAQKLFNSNKMSAEVWHGNFLPEHAKHLSEESDPVVSLSHSIPPAYEEHSMDLEDFAIVFAYPWPGEEHFLRLVFERYARAGALLLLYRGPFQIELYRKQGH